MHEDQHDVSNGSDSLEVVEIKNTCPFRLQVHMNRSGRAHRRYAVADRGPRERVRGPVCLSASITVLALFVFLGLTRMLTKRTQALETASQGQQGCLSGNGSWFWLAC